MKIQVFDLKISERPMRKSYTALVAPTWGSFPDLDGGDIDYTAPFIDADGNPDTENPVSAIINEAISMIDIGTDVSSVEIHWRTVADPETVYSFGNATDNGGGNWAFAVESVEAVFVGTALEATSSPWENVELRAKLTSPEGVTYSDWTAFTISHVFPFTSYIIPWDGYETDPVDWPTYPTSWPYYTVAGLNCDFHEDGSDPAGFNFPIIGIIYDDAYASATPTSLEFRWDISPGTDPQGVGFNWDDADIGMFVQDKTQTLDHYIWVRADGDGLVSCRTSGAPDVINAPFPDWAGISSTDRERRQLRMTWSGTTVTTYYREPTDASHLPLHDDTGWTQHAQDATFPNISTLKIRDLGVGTPPIDNDTYPNHLQGDFGNLFGYIFYVDGSIVAGTIVWELVDIASRTSWTDHGSNFYSTTFTDNAGVTALVQASGGTASNGVYRYVGFDG